jgi:hypothetical protein
VVGLCKDLLEGDGNRPAHGGCALEAKDNVGKALDELHNDEGDEAGFVDEGSIEGGEAISGLSVVGEEIVNVVVGGSEGKRRGVDERGKCCD